jgi:hypothetical protein
MRTTGVEQVINNIQALFPEAERQVTSAIVTSSARTEQDYAARISSVDSSGDIRAKLKSTFKKRKGLLVGEVRSGARHAFFAEFGTGTHMRLSPAARAEGFKPGKQQPYFPNVRRLGHWLLRHTQIFFPGRRVYDFGPGKKAVVIGREEEQQAAFLIARAIRRKGGTPAHPALFPAYAREKPNFFNKLRAIPGLLARRRVIGKG